MNMKTFSVVTFLFFGIFSVSSHLCLEETNRVREKFGLHPYKIDSALAEAAKSHNDRLIELHCFSHRCPGEPRLADRVDYTGYVFGRIGENIAGGYTDCEGAIGGWLNSPKHRKILLGNYVHMGCVFRKCSSCPWVNYITCVYGSHFWF